jgi:hypothetical protein
MTAPAPLCDLAKRINLACRKVEDSFQNMLDHAIEAGGLLIEAKDTVGHGGWLAWLNENCRVSPRQSQNYMRLAREVPKLGANAQRVSQLTMRDALRAISTDTKMVAALPHETALKVIADARQGERFHTAATRARNHQRFAAEAAAKTAAPPREYIEGVIEPASSGDFLPSRSTHPEISSIGAEILAFCLGVMARNPSVSKRVMMEAINEAYCAVEVPPGNMSAAKLSDLDEYDLSYGPLTGMEWCEAVDRCENNGRLPYKLIRKLLAFHGVPYAKWEAEDFTLPGTLEDHPLSDAKGAAP